MTRTFLSHIHKSFTRSASFGKDNIVQLTIGLLIFSFVVYAIALGASLESIIVNVLKQNNAITFLNSLLLYYFIGGFFTRYLIQNLPALDAQPYLHLPVARGKIVNFILTKSLFHISNISAFLLFTPFAMGAIANAYGNVKGWSWLLSLWAISLINHFLVILIKKNFSPSIAKTSIFITICLAIGVADYYGWIQLSLVSEWVFNSILNNHILTVLLLITVIFCYYICYRTFINKLYVEEVSVQQVQTLRVDSWEFLKNLGSNGRWISLELKLIFRHKRSRELFMMHIIFILMPVAAYLYMKNPTNYTAQIFFAVVCGGFFTMNYGQFLYSWQSEHFDFVLTKPTSLREFVESKFLLLTATTVLWFVVSIPFVFFGWQYLLINFVAALFNIGVNSFIVMNLSMWGAKRLNLNHPGAVNIEGVGAAQWIMSIPLIASPFIFYVPFNMSGYPILGICAVGTAGLLGIFFRKKMIDLTSTRLFNLRHKMASNFRND